MHELNLVLYIVRIINHYSSSHWARIDPGHVNCSMGTQHSLRLILKFDFHRAPVNLFPRLHFPMKSQESMLHFLWHNNLVNILQSVMHPYFPTLALRND